MPRQAIERLGAEVRRSLADPVVLAKLAKLGIEPMIMSPAELTTYIAAEIDKWGGVVKAANIKAE
jgi:tripartite-type tricarboxylate transporter receptor subunit TctC